MLQFISIYLASVTQTMSLHGNIISYKISIDDQSTLSQEFVFVTEACILSL